MAPAWNMSTNEENLTALRDSIDKALADERFDEAAMGLIDLAEQAPSDDERADAISKAASLFEDKLGDAEQAGVLRGVLAELLEESEQFAKAAEVLELLVTQGVDVVDRLEHLAGLYAELENWDKLVETYNRLIELAEGEDAKITIYRQRALIEKEALGQHEEALKTQEAILSLAPDDEEAFNAIIAGYEDASRWQDLQKLYEARAASDAEAKTEWLKKAADAAEKGGGDSSEKNRLLAAILEQSPDDTQAFEALEDQARKNGDWTSLSDLLVKRADAKEEVIAKLDLLVEAGQVQEGPANNPGGAIPYYERALRVKKDHLPAIDGLLSALNATEQYELASKVYELKLHLSGGETQEIDARLAMAHLKLNKLKDRSQAMEIYEQTLQIDPDCREALIALGLDFLEREAWIEATPLLERALGGFEADVDPTLRASVLTGIGRCSFETYNEERAKDTYDAALQIGPLETQDLVRLADLCFRNEENTRAQDLYQQVLDRSDENLDSKALRQVKMRLGECAAKLGLTGLAMDYIAEMGEESSEDIEDLERMVQVHATSENWTGVIASTKQLLAKRTQDIERFQDKLVIGDAYLQGLKDAEKAVEAYEEALQLGTFSRAPLLSLVQIHADQGRFEETLTYLQQLADLEETHDKKSKWLMSMASVVQDSLNDLPRAAKMYEQILDQDSSRLEAFEALVGILSQTSDVRTLEAAYKQMIERLQSQSTHSPDKKVLFMLYRNLGELYYQELKDRPQAIQAFENALLHHGAHEATREKLARLCVRTPEYLERAQFHYRLLISHYPKNFTAYHSLSAIWASQGNLDGSWRIAGLLTLFNNAMDAEKRLYEKHVSSKPISTAYHIDDEGWLNHVRAREQKTALTDVFRLICPIISGSFFHQNAKALGLGKKQELTKTTHPALASTAESTARLLGIPTPALYLNGDSPVAVTQAAEGSLTVSEAFSKETQEKLIAYQMARQMTYLRPEHFLARHFDPHALQGLYMAAGCAVNPDFAVRVHQSLPADQANQAVHFIQEAALLLKQQLKPADSEALKKAIAEVETNFGTRTIEEWRRGVELTATFASLIAVGDILLVGTTIMEDAVALSTLTNAEKMQATVGYGLSERYTQLRALMQVGVGNTTEG